MPLDLASSQWEPLVPELAARYSTVTRGGPLVGVVALLEGRGRSNYLAAIRAVLDLAHITPGEIVLEVGGGSGVASARDRHSREIHRVQGLARLLISAKRVCFDRLWAADPQ